MKYLFTRYELLQLLKSVIKEVDPDTMEEHPTLTGVSKIETYWGHCTLSDLLNWCLEESEE